MLSVTSLFLIRWFVCRPESREGEYPAHWWPCRFPSLQAVKKIKTLEKKPPSTLKQRGWEPTPPGLTLRNVVFIFLTGGVNLVDGTHGSWRDEKKPKVCCTKDADGKTQWWGRVKPTVWHHRTTCKMCEISIISAPPATTLVSFYLCAYWKIESTPQKL